MALDQMIDQLNRKRGIADVQIDNLANTDLTDDEKEFIKKYRPEDVLIIYGTLAPGKPNHSKIEHIEGQWKTGTVKGGKLEGKGWGAALGFNGFVPAKREEQVDIAAQVLFSEQLQENWALLDAFEGEGYRRILAAYQLSDGQVGVGYIYAIHE